MLVLKSCILLFFLPAAIATRTTYGHLHDHNASSIRHPAHAVSGGLSTETTTLHDLEAVFVLDGFVDMIGWARGKDSMFRASTDLDDAAQSAQESIDIVSAAEKSKDIKQTAPVLLEHLALYRQEVNKTQHLVPGVQDHISRTASYLSTMYGRALQLGGISQPVGPMLIRYVTGLDCHAQDLRAVLAESLESLDCTFNLYLDINTVVLSGDCDDALLAEHILVAKGALNSSPQRGLATFPMISYANVLVMRRVSEFMIFTVRDVGAYLQNASGRLDAGELEGWARGIVGILERIDRIMRDTE